MFLLNIDKVVNTDVFKNLYSAIADYRLYSQITIVYTPDLSLKSYKMNNLIISFMKINLDDMVNMNDSDIEDILFDLVEVKANILFNKGNCSDDFIEKIKEMAMDSGVKYSWFGETDLTKEVSLKTLSKNDLYSIYEFFDKSPNVPAYTLKNFLVRCTINNDGNIIEDSGKVVGNVLEKAFIHFVFRKPSDLNKTIKNSKKNISSLFGVKMYDETVFLSVDDNINQKIIEYKKRLFNLVKNIDPCDYKHLPRELVEILNECNYIKFDDLYPIIKGEDEFMVFS